MTLRMVVGIGHLSEARGASLSQNKCLLQFCLFHAQRDYYMSYIGFVAQQWWLALRLWNGFSRDPHLHFSGFA